MAAQKILLAVFLSFSFLAQAANELELLPVQDGGRKKPFDSFAREQLELVYGKATYEGRPAYEVIFTWMLTPEAWAEKELFQVGLIDVKKELGLDPEKKRFTGAAIFNSPVFPDLMGELRDQREAKEKLTPYFQALQRLESQYYIFTEIAAGRRLKVLPADGAKSWIAVADLPEKYQPLFGEISKNFVENVAAEVEGKSNEERQTVLNQLNESVLKFKQTIHAEAGDQYASEKDMKIEVHFNHLHPFRWSAVFYGLSLFFFLIVWITQKKTFNYGAILFLILGFALHIYGFGLRVYLTGHPPVTNMYETVVWVAFGSISFAAILQYFMKNQFLLLGGTMVATLCMIIADNAPVILDDSIQPLEAVLRSNYWLTIHVLTITISYAAFFLAMALGDIGLVYFLRDEKKFAAEIKVVAQSVYRAIQIGVAFLAPGIILGGIWADYSWGRFWGWDPKETWALIALLGYIAVLHGRLVGWVRDFGMIACGVGTFALVIMAWYGVNFVLGAGLHSYGFGAGGVEYVAGFVLLHILLIVYAALVRREKLKVVG